MPTIGQNLAGLTLVRNLGHGSVSRVYLGHDANGAAFVLKVSASLLGEAQALAKLRHPNIVPLVAFHRQAATEAIVLPYVSEFSLARVARDRRTRSTPPDGRSLARLVQDALGPPAAATPATQFVDCNYTACILWIGAQLAHALAYAHDCSILHCDLKPGHVLLTADGDPILFDFNAASERRRLTGEGSRCIGGTLPYAAPEQLMLLCGEPVDVSPRSDIYSLGVVLFELLTGHLPAENRSSAAELRGVVAMILKRCLEIDPADRWGSATDLADALTSAAVNEGWQHSATLTPSAS